MIRSIKKDSGFSLVEVIVSLVILALVYAVMLRVLSGQKSIGVTSELYTKAIFLGKELMNTVISKQFDDNQTPPWTPTSSFGLEDNDAAYDDVDDFADFTTSSISGFPGFTEKVRVFYVLPTSLDDSVLTATDMKKIIVTVTHAGIDPVVLETIMSSHY
ncbi:MAG: type II secretion system protein [Candidatus Marinimicrobia bacterium]|nr:type II secretion system protein [Candidatus Neomarinimicrobiota bacterium]